MTPQDNDPPRLTPSLLVGCALLALSASAHAANPGATTRVANADSAAATARTHPNGMWKWVGPPVKMNGMFDDHDPIGLVAGQLIPADCAFNWTDPDSHELYCFTSATSLVYFLNSPQKYLAEAERNWRALKGKLRKGR